MFEKRDLKKSLSILDGKTEWSPDDENGEGWEQYHLFVSGGSQLGGVMRESSGSYRVWGRLDACSGIEAKGFESADLAKAATIPIIRNALQGRLNAIAFAEEYPKGEEKKSADKSLQPDGDEVVISKQSLKDLLFLSRHYETRGIYDREAKEKFAAAVAEAKGKLGDHGDSDAG